jgi:hypothetical protein
VNTRAVTGITVGGAQLRPDRHRADEHRQRQVTIIAIVSVTEAAFLLAVHQRTGRVQIEHDLGRVFGQRPYAQVQQQLRDGVVIGINPVIAVIPPAGWSTPGD